MSKTFTPKAVLGVCVALLQLGCSDSTSAPDARDAQPDTERVDAPAVDTPNADVDDASTADVTTVDASTADVTTADAAGADIALVDAPDLDAPRDAAVDATSDGAPDGADDARDAGADDARDAGADDAVEAEDAPPPCGGDVRLGTTCVPGNECELGAFACVDDSVQCVGTGSPAPSATTCRPAAGACDVAERCDGVQLTCPADAFAPATRECRASTGGCDPAETCSGTSVLCPPDALQAAGFVCRAAVGECDPAESCTGATGACPVNEFRPVGTRCATGSCDATGACNAACTPGVACATGNPCERGVVDCATAAPRCIAAGPAAAGVACRAAAGPCDVAETCDGTSTACPADAFAPVTTTCRAAAGVCDAAEACTGTGPTCPRDAYLPADTVCRASATIPACDPAERCTGVGASCPLNVLLRRPVTEVCNGIDDDCDGLVDEAGAEASCTAERVCAGGRCVDPAPRPLAPQSTATVTSRRPRFRVSLSSLVTGARVQVCRDRACATVVTTIDTLGASGAPTADLPTGVLYWRTFARTGSTVGTLASATWEFVVGVRSTTGPDASDGLLLDVNGDGRSDLTVGAPLVSTHTGRLHVFHGSATGFAATPTLSLTGPDGTNADFGGNVARAGDLNGDGYADVVVGAHTYSHDVGRAYVYLGGATGLPATPTLTLRSPTIYSNNFGRTLAGIGDVNGDGYADFAIGVPLSTNRMGSDGVVYVYYGSATGIPATPTLRITGPDGVQNRFGSDVATAMDVNGDGYSDLVASAGDYNFSTGRVYVFLGGATGLSATPSSTFTGVDGGGVTFGEEIESIGDLNGDGYADLAVSVPNYASNAGRVYVYRGSATGFPSMPSHTLASPDGGAFGLALASAGDVNADGFADLAVGARLARSYGRAYVYLGGATGLVTTPSTTMIGPDPGGFGWSVQGIGDMNADGFADLAVGAADVMSLSGRVYLFRGSATGLPATTTLTLSSPTGTNAWFGAAIARATPVGDTRCDPAHDAACALARDLWWPRRGS